jgi:hypothetical protein
LREKQKNKGLGSVAPSNVLLRFPLMLLKLIKGASEDHATFR